MREAVAFPYRSEFRVPGVADLVTIGFRSTGAMSVFLGQDPVYQFDPQGRLRRAFADGFLFRSEHSTLSRLERVRSAQSTQLRRDDLGPEELAAFRDRMVDQLTGIAASIREQTAERIRAIPQDYDSGAEILAAIGLVLVADPWISPELFVRR